MRVINYLVDHVFGFPTSSVSVVIVGRTRLTVDCSTVEKKRKKGLKINLCSNVSKKV